MPAFVALAPKEPEVQDASLAVQEPEPALPLRSDTILGVCEGLGQEFGFNPLYLRVTFAALFYLNPPLVTGTYLALGAGVALARWLYPVPSAAVAHSAAQPVPPAADNEDSERSRLAA
jgi:phage shock protein PspC (stress-responsive transcriptional regulator)